MKKVFLSLAIVVTLIIASKIAVKVRNDLYPRVTVRVGQTSEPVYVWGKKCLIEPDDEGVKYELTDVNGRVILWKGHGRDWKDLKIEYIRMTPTKKDITYRVKDWN